VENQLWGGFLYRWFSGHSNRNTFRTHPSQCPGKIKEQGAFLKVSMTIRGVEIIPPSDSRDAWELMFLIKSLLTWVGTQGRGAKADIETAQRRLKLPPGEYVSQGY
jgi:hypothetical protein